MLILNPLGLSKICIPMKGVGLLRLSMTGIVAQRLFHPHKTRRQTLKPIIFDAHFYGMRLSPESKVPKIDRITIAPMT